MAFHNVPPNGFPDLPDVEELEAVEKDVKTLKTTTYEQGAAITALGTAKAAKADIAPTFSAESNYAVGDLVYHEGVLYECTTAHEAAAWNAEDFTATSIDEELSAINSNISTLESGLNNLAGLKFLPVTFTDTFQANSNITDGVTVSDLTGGVLTSDNQIKGIIMFNGYPYFLFQLTYQDKVILGTDTARSMQETINVRMVILY